MTSFTLAARGFAASRLAATFAARLVAAFALSTLAAQAMAEDYPSHPVRIIVPVPPGGPSDIIVRLIAQRLTDTWKQQVIVDNRPGGNSTIGTALATRAAPDGYTLLLLVDSTMTMLPFAQKQLPYDPAALMPIMTLDDASVLLVASSRFNAGSFADVVKAAKAEPGKVSVALGSFTTQLTAARLAALAGIKLNQIPYKGVAELTQALLAGDVDLAVGGYSGFKANLGTGKFKILGTTGRHRSAAMPDVPTFGELGLAGFDSGLWVGLAAPAGTPAQVIAKVQADVTAIMSQPDVLERLKALALDPLPGNPASTAELIRTDADKWSKVIKELGFTLD